MFLSLRYFSLENCCWNIFNFPTHCEPLGFQDMGLDSLWYNCHRVKLTLKTIFNGDFSDCSLFIVERGIL